MLLLLACNSPAIDSDSPAERLDDSFIESSVDTSDSGDFIVEGWEGDPGFGWSLAWHQGRVWTGNPFLGRVEPLDQTELLTGEGFYGWSLASDGDTLFVGAPLAGEVHGEEISPGVLAGGRMAAIDGHVAWTVQGGVVVDGAFLPLDAQPSSVAWQDGSLVVGWSRGALVLEDMPRQEGDADAGYALCADEVLAIGAPSSGTVWVLSEEGTEVFEGSGRFGHSLSCLGDRVLVGAPAAGAVWMLRPGKTPELLFEGADELGVSVLLTPKGAYAGAPGNANSSAGSVLRVR